MFLLLILISAVSILFAFSGCSPRSKYNNEYLNSARHLEQGLKDHPDSANKEAIKKRIKKLHELHADMLEQERKQQEADSLSPNHTGSNQ